MKMTFTNAACVMAMFSMVVHSAAVGVVAGWYMLLSELEPSKRRIDWFPSSSEILSPRR